jgi:hypothetical protein
MLCVAKTKTKGKSKGPSLADRIKADPALRAKYLANPGLRSKLPDSYLSPAQRKQRALNLRLNSPITPGSTLTGRDLAREAAAATDVRFGPQERALQTQQAQATQQGKDVAGWYDQYLKELGTHAANTQQINSEAVGQMQRTGAGLRALDQTQFAQQQQALATDAAGRGATPANLGPDASNASLVRQAMLAGFSNQQALTGGASNRYADTVAHVVGPGQKLQARAQSARGVRDVADKLTGLAADKGAYNQEYRANRLTSEASYALANRTLEGNQANDRVNNSIDAARLAETQRANDLRNQNAAADRRQREAAQGQKVNQYGYTAKDWAALSTAERQRIIAEQRRSFGKGPSKPRLLTNQQHSAAKDQIDLARTWIRRLQSMKSKSGAPLTSTQIRAALESGERGKDSAGNPIVVPKLPKDFVNAAYDLVVYGALSAANVAALHRRGLSIRRLGYPTAASQRGGQTVIATGTGSAGTGTGGATLQAPVIGG